MEKKKLRQMKKAIFIGELFLFSFLTSQNANPKRMKENSKSILLESPQEPRDFLEENSFLSTDISHLNPININPQFLWTIEEKEVVNYLSLLSNHFEEQMKKMENRISFGNDIFIEIKSWIEIQKKRSERIYYDLPIDLEFQDYIYDTSEKFEVPAILGFLLPHIESRGTWKTNGVVSITDDYGLTQINALHLEYILENYGYSKDQVQNDPYVNMECCIRLLHDRFMPLYGYDLENYDILDICGAYNTGNTNWQKSEWGLNYVSFAEEYLNTVFSEGKVLERKR